MESQALTTVSESSTGSQTGTVAEQFRWHICSWAELWRLPEMERRLRVRFSARLNYALGRADASRWTITLSDVLLLEANQNLLPNILCHEAAHIAAYRRYGVFIEQHGPEWQELVRAAGFAPRVSTRVEEVFGLQERRTTAQRQYEYHCTECGFTAVRRAKNRWLRCGVCQRAGREGLLTITRLYTKLVEQIF